jgi:hypothetical protein
MKARILKGVYNLNPTRMIMKQGSKDARDATARSPRTSGVKQRAATKKRKTK